MPKRTPAFDAAQAGFDFDLPPVLSSDGMLSGLGRQTASAVARILKEDERDRYDVAAAMSRVSGTDISKSMIDKYSSESSEEHNISFDRMLFLIAATRRYDILRALLRRIGCDLIEGEEILTVELGHMVAQRARIEERIRHLRKAAPAIKRGGGVG